MKKEGRDSLKYTHKLKGRIKRKWHVRNKMSKYRAYYYPAHMRKGLKQSVCPSFVVVVIIVGTKIARSRALGTCACCKHNQSVDIGEKLVCTCFELLKKAY